MLVKAWSRVLEPSSILCSLRKVLLGLRPQMIAEASKQIWHDQRGSIAIEFALIAGFLVFLLLNGMELGRYIYLRSQLENATQAGGHAVWKACDPTKLPIATKCSPEGKTAVKTVVSSMFGTVDDDDITLTEGYFCTSADGVLHAVTNPASLPSVCQTGIVAGDYVQVQITYSYAPLFANLTLGRLFGTSISTTSYMRLQ